jgi:hypothetical protein
MRATNLAIALACLLATVTFANAALAPVLGVSFTTGAQEDVNQSEANLTDDVDSGVTNDGDLSPLSGLDFLKEMINHLGNADTILVNLGVPPIVAQWLTAPIIFVMAMAMVAVLLRTRLG